ncbi:hypothetical protein HHK36_000357 [Tetracentron sinense]|uniref:Cytochrome P450 n=1 Tax=Tetracentron sinense TaxID=13715 RepID=A0A835DPX8_TETSI|nr:hypothetical protein HHK36_000357 [Tetracentron sinense]
MMISNLWSWWWESSNPKDELARLLLTLSTVALLIFWFSWLLKKSKNGKLPLPPGPKGLPLVGNLPFLDPELHTYFSHLSRTYGPVTKLQLGNKLGIVVSSPSSAKEVLKDQDVTFANRDVPFAALVVAYGGSDIVWTPYGPEWRMLRKVCVREMLSNTSLDSVYTLRRREVRRTVEYLYSKTGSPINVGEQVFLTVLNVITSMLWGGTLKGEERNSLGMEFREVIGDITELLGMPNVSDFFPGLAWLDLQGIKKKMGVLFLRFDGIFNSIIDQRLKMDGSKEGESKDFLQFLLQLKEEGDAKTPLTMKHLKALLMINFSLESPSSHAALRMDSTEVTMNSNLVEKLKGTIYESNPKDQLSRVAVLTLFVATVSIFLFIWSFKKARKGTLPLPPGPRGLPIVGYLPFLDSDMHRSFAELAKIYGPIMKLQLGSKLSVVLSSASLAKEVLRDQDIAFANRDPPIAASTIANGGTDIAWSSYGPNWRMVRKYYHEMLHSSGLACSARRRHVIEKAVREVYTKIGTPINVGELGFLTIFEVVLSMLWGGTGEESSVGGKFYEMAEKLVELMEKRNISDLFPVLASFDIQGVEGDMKKLLQRFDKVFDPIIDQRLKLNGVNGERIPNKKGNKDFLQFLLEREEEDNEKSLTRTEIKAVILLKLGSKLCVVLSSASLAKEVLRDRDITFANRDPPIAASTIANGSADIAWSPYGPDWRLLRKYVREMLHSSSLACFSRRRLEVEKTVRKVYSKIGTPIKIGELAFLTNLEVVTSMLWGGTGEESSVRGEFQEMLAKPNISDFFPILAPFDIQGVEGEIKKLLQRSRL